MKDENIVIVPGDRDYSVVVVDKIDYVKIIHKIINRELQDGVYARKKENTLHDLKRFQHFFNLNFSKYEKYNILPSSNQPGQLYKTAKTHKFDYVNNNTAESLKFRPIKTQIGTHIYKIVRVISEYVKPIFENNDFNILNTQDFPQLIREEPPLKETEKYAPYDGEMLFTNVPVYETIKYVLEEICTYNKLPYVVN